MGSTVSFRILHTSRKTSRSYLYRMNTEVFQCQWSMQSYGFPGGSYLETGKFLSLALKRANNNSEPHALVLSDNQPYLDGKESLRQPYDPNSFLAESVERSTDPVIRVTFILPVLSGYVARSDFVQRRLTGSEAAQTVRGFLHPLQQINAPAHDEQRLDVLLESSIAGVLLKNGVKNFDLLPELDSSVVVCTNSIALGDVSGWVSLAVLEALIETPNPSDFVKLATEAARSNVGNVLRLQRVLEQQKCSNTSYRNLIQYTGRYKHPTWDWFIDVRQKQNGELQVAFKSLDSQAWDLNHYESDTF